MIENNVKVFPFCDITDMWKKVLRDSRRTVNKEDTNKEPSERFKKTILRSKHSPIRKLKFEIFIDEIPAYVSQQFSRHKIAIGSSDFLCWSEDIQPTDMEHFVQTSRSDRTDIPREERHQTDMVSYNFESNAQGLIDASKKRLCLAADKNAVKYWKLVKEGVNKICPELADRMQPECVCCGFCPEDSNLVKCNFSNTETYKTLRNKYKNE